MRTFVLTHHTGPTRLLVSDEIRGPLRRILRSPFSIMEEDLNDFVNAVKHRAELLG